MDMLVKSESLSSVAAAIKEKGGTAGQLVFPDGFATAIMAIQSGASGATLTVTTPAEGVVVTVAKGEKTYTKTAGADKTATFTGLETGTWTITISNGKQTATETIDIDADYASELTFFESTINITYRAGRVCTVSDGVTTLTAPDTSGTWACVVPNIGTWTVSVSGVDFTWQVKITGSGQSETVDATKVYLFGNGAVAKWSKAPEYSDYVTIGSTKITIDGLDGRWPVAYVSSKINLTGYTHLKATVKYLGGTVAEDVGACIGVNSSVHQDMTGYEAYYIGAKTTETAFNLPISISGDRYILIGCYAAKYEFTSVWLE